MLAPREDPSADFVWPLASFDGAALSSMGTSQNVPDTLVFHFEAGADSATLDMPVVAEASAGQPTETSTCQSSCRGKR